MRAVLTGRWAGAAHKIGVVLIGATIMVLVGLQANGCDSREHPFQCGVRLESDPTVTTSCDGPNEVCICWTHYCGRQQTPDHVPTEVNYCASGFRYRRDPFGPLQSSVVNTTEPGEDAGPTATSPEVAIDGDLGDCVPPALVEWKVVGTQLCEDSEHAPNIFQKDGGLTTDGGGGIGGTTSTATTSGGVGGTGGSGGTATGSTGGSQ
jgi:hypothetical protein